MKPRLLWLYATTFVFAFAVQPTHAQVITSTEIERGLRYRGTTPYDGEPYTQRYSYGTGATFFLNGNAAQLRYLDYLDRADRAEKFGYPMPADPFFEAPPAPVHPNVRVGVGFGTGYGIFRRR